MNVNLSLHYPTNFENTHLFWFACVFVFESIEINQKYFTQNKGMHWYKAINLRPILHKLIFPNPSSFILDRWIAKNRMVV